MNEETHELVEKEEVIAIRECDLCKQTLHVVRMKDERTVATDATSGEQHVCWDLPQDANLLVL